MLDGLKFNVTTDKFDNCEKIEALRYLKGIYTNKARFESRYLKSFENSITLKGLYTFMLENYDDIIPFTYKEAFELENQEFMALVFGSINIVEMIDNLGSKRLEVEGKRVSRKTYHKNGDFDKMVENDVIYETYEVSGDKLNLTHDLYVVKCWCTSTNKEHYIWIEEQYKNSPLEAIASTFRFHENIIPYIKELKRQGDVMLVEMTEDIEPSGDIIPLTAEQYFSLLTAES